MTAKKPADELHALAREMFPKSYAQAERLDKMRAEPADEEAVREIIARERAMPVTNKKPDERNMYMPIPCGRCGLDTTDGDCYRCEADRLRCSEPEPPRVEPERKQPRKKPDDEARIREWIRQGRSRVSTTSPMALNALEAALGVKRYVMAASVDPESPIVEFIDVEDLLAAILGALEGNDA